MSSSEKEVLAVFYENLKVQKLKNEMNVKIEYVLWEGCIVLENVDVQRLLL